MPDGRARRGSAESASGLANAGMTVPHDVHDGLYIVVVACGVDDRKRLNRIMLDSIALVL